MSAPRKKIKASLKDESDEMTTNCPDLNEKNINAATALHIAVSGCNTENVEALLRAGANTEVLNAQNETPIFEAVRNQRKDILQYLLDHGANVNHVNESNQTPLYMAVELCDVSIAELLVMHGADVNIHCGSHLKTCLHEAADKSCLPIVQLLIKSKADVNAVNNDLETPLSVAVSRGNLAVVNALIAAKADVNWEDKNYTVISRAVDQNNIDVLKSLIDANADISAKNNTALHFAVRRDNTAAVHVLIDAGADVNVIYHDQDTPLLEAVQGGNLSIVKALVEAGADMNRRGRYHTAITKAVTEMIWRFKIDLLKYLIDAKGANINCRDYEGKSALHLAIREGNLAAVELLVTSGADVNIQIENDFRTPLSFAVSEYLSNLSFVKVLINAGANVNWKDKYGTIIWRAAHKGNIDVLQFLIDAGVDVNVENDDGETALGEAIFWKRIEIIKILMAAGAHVDGPALCCAIQQFSSDLNMIVSLLKACGDINKPNSEGCYPLHYAVRSCKKKLVKLLVKAGANVNCCNNDNKTPLYLEFTKDFINMNCVKYLLKAKADPLILNKEGKTAFCKARYLASTMLKYALLYNPDLQIPDFLHVHDEWPEYGDEVRRMKNQLLSDNSNISLYDLLLEDNSNALACHVSNTNFDSVSEVKTFYEAHYPKYSSLILRNIRKGITKTILMEKCYIVMDHLELRSLPLEIKRAILKYLKNPDLKNIIACAL